MSCPSGCVSMVSLSRLTVPVLVMVFILTLANTMHAQTQTDGSRQVSGVGASQATPTSVRTPVLVPYISVAERYDSNVLFLPTNAKQDFVTNVAAGTRVNYQDDLVAGTLRGGFTSEVYARNPGLNYIGTNAAVNAVLDKAVGRMIHGLGLTITDTVTYSPKPQAWLTPEVTENSFISGIQTYRNNTLTNISTASSTYALTPSDDLKASYSYQMIRFYNTTSAVPGAFGGLFNTDVHAVSAGFEHHINLLDSIGISYQHQRMSFQPNTGGPSNGLDVDGARITWRKSLAREWTAVISPGVAVLSTLPGEPQWTMLANLEWRASMTTTVASYSRSILPAFFLAGSAMVSDGVNLSILHNLTNQWSIGAQGNYARSSSVGSASGNLQFNSYGGRSFLNYTFYPGLMASGTATWDRFEFGGTSSGNLTVNRQTVALSLIAEWN